TGFVFARIRIAEGRARPAIGIVAVPLAKQIGPDLRRAALADTEKRDRGDVRAPLRIEEEVRAAEDFARDGAGLPARRIVEMGVEPHPIGLRRLLPDAEIGDIGVHQEARTPLRIEREGIARDVAVATVIENLGELPALGLRAILVAGAVIDLRVGREQNTRLAVRIE